MSIRTVLLAGAAALAVGQSASAQTEISFINCGAPDGVTPEMQNSDIAEWEALNPDYKVLQEYVPWGQCQEKAITLASAGDPVGLAYLGSRTLPQLADAGLIVPVEMSEAEQNSYEPSVLSTVKFNGGIWGLPRAFSTKGIFFNKAILEEAGLDMPNGPQTWDDMIVAAKAITENTDAKALGIPAASFDNTMHAFLNFIYSNGGEVINSDGEVVFNSPEVIETFQFYKDMAAYAQEGPVAYDRGKLEPLFSEGKVAMIVQSFGYRSRTGDVDYGITWIPKGPSGEHATLLITDSLAVFKGSGVEDAAMSLAKFLNETDRQARFDDVAGWTPVRETDISRALVNKDPNWKFYLESIAAGGPEPQVIDYNALQDVMNEAIQGVILGELSPEEAAADVAKELEDLVE
ncbi:Inositol transport system sugar-binding protein [Candidatus Rhodobacter oscarellae]|uniref:Inositol transport system sugar-binding protein n=1 Tax=Candidatus Rhodobacter oscarellae TaxID=1675527 RepID=A0A0J9EDD5_9RHOB|nr:sugar ABC transporter substrate-binding protein [Candidatus Rhodobacter lobularis]KMW60720.1 Inositol transport system sugar-binding protein [Candidatus Rhodobacter lobularis]